MVPEREDGAALETLALLYARFEQVNIDLAKVDKKVDKEFALMQAEMGKAEEVQRLMEISAQAVHESRPSSGAGV